MGTFDTAIVGGGIAGLSAALTLARVCRSVIILDSGAHRNTVAAHSHGFISRDGLPPNTLLDEGRADLERYGVERRIEWIEQIERKDDLFILHPREGEPVQARTVLLATGVVDTLPDIEGLAEAWGQNVVHCPYCHGYELRGRPTVVLGSDRQDVDKAGLLVGLTREVTLCTNGPASLEEEEMAILTSRGVALEERKVARVRVERDEAVGIVFEDGSEKMCSAIYITPDLRLANDLATSLGVAVENDNHIVTSDHGRTGVPGVYAAGDGSGSAHQLIAAAESGRATAGAINSDLVERGARYD